MLFSVCQPSLQSAGIEVRSPQTCPIPGKQPREKIYSGTFIISFVSFDLCDLACFRNLSAQTQGSQNVPLPCLKFLTNCGAYQIFLFVLTLTSFQRDTQFLEYSITGEYRRILKVSILYFLFQLDFLEDLAYFLNVMIKQARNKII